MLIIPRDFRAVNIFHTYFLNIIGKTGRPCDLPEFAYSVIRPGCEAPPAPFARGEFSSALLGWSPDAVVVFAVVVLEDEAVVVVVVEPAAGEGDGEAAVGASDAAGCSTSGFFAAAGSSFTRYCEKI